MSYRGLGSENRFDEDISLDELAALVTLSRFHFCTAFRLATGRAGRPCRVPLDGICVSKEPLAKLQWCDEFSTGMSGKRGVRGVLG
jgi:hypothetical protein